MSRLTRDGTAEPVSRDQILRHARGQGNIIFSVQLTTSRIGNLTGLIHTLLYVMTIHTYIHTYSSIGARQHSIPARGKCAQYARELSFARCHDDAGAIILQGSAAGNTSRTGRSNSPAARSAESEALKKLRIWNCEEENQGLLHTARPGRHGRRQEQRVYSPGVLQVTEF